MGWIARISFCIVLCVAAYSGDSKAFGASMAPQIEYISTSSETDFGARVNDALDALPASGGTVDASALKADQQWTTSILIDKPIKLILPCVSLIAKNANLVIRAHGTDGRLNGVDVGGCGESTKIITEGGGQYRNRVIRVLGNYAPELIDPPVGPVAAGNSSSASANISEIRNAGVSGSKGLLETIKVGDSLSVIGASTRSSVGFVSPVKSIHGNQIVLAHKIPVGVGSGTLRLSLGGYGVATTKGTIQAGSKLLTVLDAEKYKVGDMLRVTGAGLKEHDLFALIEGIEKNTFSLSAAAATSVFDQLVIFVAMSGQNELVAANAVEAESLRAGDWVLMGEWMNYAANNSDWNRMEWGQVKAIKGNRIELMAPLRADYGYEAYQGENGYPVCWRKVNGLVERVRIHDLEILSHSKEAIIGIEAQNGRLLEVDHVTIKLNRGLGFETVSQYGAMIHDNYCESELCADFGGLTYGRIDHNEFRNTGRGPVAILELGSAHNTISNNKFLNADFKVVNPNVAALGGASIDFNVIEKNVARASSNASCFSLLGGRGNVYRDNKCDGGMVGFNIQEWGGPSPVRLASQNVIVGNSIRAVTGVAITSTLTSRSAGNLNFVGVNDIDKSVTCPISLIGNTTVEFVENYIYSGVCDGK